MTANTDQIAILGIVAPVWSRNWWRSFNAHAGKPAIRVIPWRSGCRARRCTGSARSAAAAGGDEPGRCEANPDRGQEPIVLPERDRVTPIVEAPAPFLQEPKAEGVGDVGFDNPDTNDRQKSSKLPAPPAKSHI